MLGDGLYPEVFTVQSLHPSEKCLLIWSCPVRRCCYLSSLKPYTSLDGQDRKQKEKKGKLLFAWKERKGGDLKLKGLAWGHIESQWQSPE